MPADSGTSLSCTQARCRVRAVGQERGLSPFLRGRRSAGSARRADGVLLSMRACSSPPSSPSPSPPPPGASPASPCRRTTRPAGSCPPASPRPAPACTAHRPTSRPARSTTASASSSSAATARRSRPGAGNDILLSIGGWNGEDAPRSKRPVLAYGNVFEQHGYQLTRAAPRGSPAAATAMASSSPGSTRSCSSTSGRDDQIRIDDLVDPALGRTSATATSRPRRPSTRPPAASRPSRRRRPG